MASIGVTYYVDFLRNIMENDDIKRWLSYDKDPKTHVQISFTYLYSLYYTAGCVVCGKAGRMLQKYEIIIPLWCFFSI